MPALLGAGTRDDILAGADRFAPDVVVVDCMMDAGLEVAHLLGLPSAVLVHLPYSAFRYEWGDEATRAEKARLLDEAAAVLALVPPGFDTPCPLPANTTYVGPITDPNPRPPLNPRDAGLLAEPGRPWVLLSLSTTVQGQAATLPRILDAVAALPVRVLLTLGGPAGQRRRSAPERDGPRVRPARPAAAADGSRHLPWRSQHHYRGSHCGRAAGLHPAGT
jgi:hypothetical protein